MQTCPTCQREIQDGSQECPHCGVVFAKWKAHASELPLAPANRKQKVWNRKKIIIGLVLPLALSGIFPATIIYYKVKVERFCAHAVVGEPIEELAAQARSLGIKVISPRYPTDPDTGRRLQVPVQSIFYVHLFVHLRKGCAVQHLDGKITAIHSWESD